VVDNPVAETGVEEPSIQVLPEENQSKLKEIFSWLQRDARDQIKNIDRFEEILESIDQEHPENVKTSLESISELDIHYVAIRRALKSQSSRSVLEQKRAKAEQVVKESQARIDSNKEILAKLQPALELKITRKAALEIELKNLSAEIEADKKRIAELPGLTEKIQREASAAMTESNQLEAQLSTLSNIQKDCQERLENIHQTTSKVSDVIGKYLNM
jgi:chromosome segregation ATPase